MMMEYLRSKSIQPLLETLWITLYVVVLKFIISELTLFERELQTPTCNFRSVVVDNTHADAEARKKFVEAARLCPKLKAVRCFVMAATMAQARYAYL